MEAIIYKDSYQQGLKAIPSDWLTTTIDEITSVVTKGTTPTSVGFNFTNSGINFIKVESITVEGCFVSDKFAYINPETDQALKRSRIEENDILFSIAGALGRIAIAKKNVLPANTNQALAIIRLLPTHADHAYLSYYLRGEYIVDRINKINVQSAQANLSLGDIRAFPVLLPPIPEQKKIARILSSVDSKLALIDQQITTTQTLKKGLMQKLFTQGVGTQDADGRWQPHTNFQESELGKVPAGWAVTKLDELVTRGSGHTPDKQHPEYWNGGIKWISLADSSRLDKGIISTTDKEISHLGIDNSSAVLHPKGTVVMSRDAGIGKSAVMGEDMAVSQHFIAWSCEQKGKLNNWFLYYLLQLMKPEFERIAIGSTIKTIGLPYFKKLKIAHPIEIAEQNEIARILSTVDRKLNHLHTQKTQTQQLKKGLMQKLLTGQIRVQPDPQDN